MSTLFPTNPPTNQPTEENTNTGNRIDNNTTQITISFISAAVAGIILIYFIKRYFWPSSKRKGNDMFSGYELNLIPFFVFLLVAATISGILEVSFNSDSQASHNRLYKDRVNEKFIYSYVGLILSFWMFFKIQDRSDVIYSPIMWAWIFFGSMIGILILTLITMSTGEEFFSDQTRPGLVPGLIMVVYSFGVLGLSFKSETSLNTNILRVISFCLFVAAVTLVFIKTGSSNPDFTLRYNNVWDNNESYSSLPIVGNTASINWNNKNNVKLDFVIDLGSLRESETLISCGDSWSVTYDKTSQSINFVYGSETLVLPITGNMVTIDVSSIPVDGSCESACNTLCNSSGSKLICQSECKTAKCEGNNPSAAVLNVIPISIIIRSIKNFDRNEGNIVMYSNNDTSQSVESKYFENMSPSEDWDSTIEVVRNRTIRNFFVNQELPPDFGDLDIGYKLTYIASMSVLFMIIIIIIIHPRSREFILGFNSNLPWVGNAYNQMFN